MGGAGWGGGYAAGLGVTDVASASPAEKASATEARYNKLKEKHSELITTHAELLRKVGPGGADGGRWEEGALSAAQPSLSLVPAGAERRHGQAADGDTAEPGGGGAGEGAAGLPGGAGETGVRDEGTSYDHRPCPVDSRDPQLHCPRDVLSPPVVAGGAE